MFTSIGWCYGYEAPLAPGAVKPPENAGNHRIMDGWSRFYLASAIMHPTEDVGVETDHLAAFDAESAPRGGLKMNSQGMGLADLSEAMRVAKEAESFFETLRSNNGDKAVAAPFLAEVRGGVLPPVSKKQRESSPRGGLLPLLYPQRAACAT